jgi:hypothetical protein
MIKLKRIIGEYFGQINESPDHIKLSNEILEAVFCLTIFEIDTEEQNGFFFSSSETYNLDNHVFLIFRIRSWSGRSIEFNRMLR